jgi:hypothetical protein
MQYAWESRETPKNVFVGKHAGKTLLERTRHKYEDNVKMNLKGTEWVSVEWIHLIQHRNQ